MNAEGVSATELVSLLISTVSLVGTIVTIGMAWQKLRDRSDENKRRIEVLENTTVSIASFEEIRRRVVQLEADGACYESLGIQLTQLSTDIGWIKRDLDRRANGGAGHGSHHGQTGKNHP